MRYQMNALCSTLHCHYRQVTRLPGGDGKFAICCSHQCESHIRNTTMPCTGLAWRSSLMICLTYYQPGLHCFVPPQGFGLIIKLQSNPARYQSVHC